MTILSNRESFFIGFIFLLLSLYQKHVFAATQSYVAYLGSHVHAGAVDVDQVRNSHSYLLGSVMGSNDSARDAIFYSYLYFINGFSANLDEEVAKELAKHPDVVSVFLNKRRVKHTTRSWGYLGLEDDEGSVPNDSVWEKAKYGEDIIIANIDSGVWPESKSFSDEGMGPIPSKWKGVCQNITCNRKLIGARYFNKALAAEVDPKDVIFNTPRDDEEGHGTHTLSTLGGTYVPNVNVNGFANGTAKGGLPKARVAAYKVCYPATPKNPEGCWDSEIIAAFDAAISDGVDIISASIGLKENHDYFDDSSAIGAFHAVKNGIPVFFSAGNDGPTNGTVVNVAPWVTTVAASSIDREFATYVELGNKVQLQGKGMSTSSPLEPGKLYPLITGLDAKSDNGTAQEAQICRGSMDSNKLAGKIIVCVLKEKENPFIKELITSSAGALGMILVDESADGRYFIDESDHLLPFSHINYTDGVSVFSYINSTDSPVATLIPKSILNKKPTPVMADFSSRGPSSLNPEILKPDITAPGVQIIASVSQVNNESSPYRIADGTSMSCPHVAAIAGLVKSVHPDWTPEEIKSALMTTAKVQDNTDKPMLDSFYQPATPFSYGSGHVSAKDAIDPGLIYELNIKDYYRLLCAVGYTQAQIKSVTDVKYKCAKQYNVVDFNYPSITVPNLNGTIVVTRRIRNVGEAGNYTVSIQEPKGIKVSIEPTVLNFNAVGRKKKFDVTLTVQDAGAAKDYVFGSYTWADGKHVVRSPIVVKAV